MRRAHVALLAAVIASSACDPVYRIGARLQLGPSAPDSCILASMRRALERGPFDGTDVRPGSPTPIRVPMSVSSIAGDSAWTIQRNSQLLIEPQSAVKVECVAVGLGGHKACEAGS